MNQSEHNVAVQALIARLAPIVSDASITLPHTVILSALLTMYRTTALHSPRCIEVAAKACMAVGAELAVNCAVQLPPSGAPLH